MPGAAIIMGEGEKGDGCLARESLLEERQFFFI